MAHHIHLIESDIVPAPYDWFTIRRAADAVDVVVRRSLPPVRVGTILAAVSTWLMGGHWHL